MFDFFRSVAARIKAMFAANAALDLEAEMLSRSAERKAELLRRAQQYEQEGLGGIALHLRQQAERIDFDKPLASVLPALAHWQGDAAMPPSDGTAPPRLLSEPKRSERRKALSHARKNDPKS